jgi:glutathione-regulated potassium-efflux system ancillary protein KefC
VGCGQGLRRHRAIVFGGRLLLRPALRWIARSDTPEIFTAAALLLVVATAALMQSVGLSMALGAFLAGVLLAESEYRKRAGNRPRTLQGPAAGAVLHRRGHEHRLCGGAARPLVVAAVVAGFLLLKAAVLWAMARTAMPLPLDERPVFVVLLAQGGEFGFVVFQGAFGAGVIDAATSSLLVAAVALSMLLTPLLLVAADRWWARCLKRQPPRLAEIDEPQHAPVIIAGFGRYGQIVGRLLSANGMSATVLDHSAEQVETCAASAGGPSTATPRGWTCCAWPAPSGARLRAGHRRRGAERGLRAAGEGALPAADHRCARTQRQPLLQSAGNWA